MLKNPVCRPFVPNSVSLGILGDFTMSLREFPASLKSGKFGENDRKWFPAWLKRDAEFMKHGDGSAIPLSKDSAVVFCVMLRGNGVPAWQRRLAVRALMAYRDAVLKVAEPELNDMVIALSRLAEQKKQLAAGGREYYWANADLRSCALILPQGVFGVR